MNVDRGRWISGPAEVHALAAFNGAAIAAAGQAGYLHPGDVLHRAFGGNRRFDPTRLVRVWEDASGIAAWSMLQPRHSGFDLQVRPDRRAVELEAELAEWSRRELRRVLANMGRDPTAAIIDAFTDDPSRIAALESTGWLRGNYPYFLTERTTAQRPDVSPADGYEIRPSRGVAEADAIGALHSAAFGSIWEPGEYATLIGGPDYRYAEEYLAVAPDGTLAAFTVTWHDEVSGRGLFEPVGTHPDHQRRGLGRAVMAAGLNNMARRGLEIATVAFEGSNPASRALYLGSGFAIAHELIDYSKPLAD